MVEAEVDISQSPSTSTCQDWPPKAANSCPPLSAQQASPTLPQPCPAPQNLTLLQPSSALSRTETESSCMEIEAAQRKLQEIENRCATICFQAIVKLSSIEFLCIFMHYTNCTKSRGLLRNSQLIWLIVRIWLQTDTTRPQTLRHLEKKMYIQCVSQQ